jgi:NADH:ubiquinone oxidoreductase subunit B-like Fe-S oxidoreductase
MKFELIFIYTDRVITVTDCVFVHYENSLRKWQFCQSIWVKLWCLLFGSACRHIEFTHGMNGACIDLGQVLAIQIKQTV